MILTSTHNLFLSKINAFSCKRDICTVGSRFLCVSMKKKTNKQKHKHGHKKHDPQVGGIFEFLARDTVYTSPVLVSWKQSLEGEFISNDVFINFRENTYLVVPLFCSVFTQPQ